ncbi:MAG: hypothetical protein AAGJ96_07905 [Pseudomonadota bacterium]
MILGRSCAVLAMLVELTASGPAGAHGFGPPLYFANDTEFEAARAACAPGLTRGDEDYVFGFSGASFVFLSSTQVLEREGTTFRAAFMVSTGEPATCMARFHVGSMPVFGSVMETEASQDGETVVFAAPDGDVELTTGGALLPRAAGPLD